MQIFDLIVVGSGSALIVMEAALAQGKKCALIEQSKLGGTCLNRGCIPSKILVHPAELIRECERSEKIGLKFAKPQIDWPKIAERMWTKINENKEILRVYQDMPNLTVFQGTASFVEPYVLDVRNAAGQSIAMLKSEQIVIGVGGRARTPNLPGLDEAGYVNYERFFGEQFPSHPYKRLLIIGGGIIGVEFAHIFSAYGTQVTLVSHSPRLVKHEEPEISTFLEAEFKSIGIDVKTNVEPIAVKSQRRPDGSLEKSLLIRDHLTGLEETLTTDEIFVAAGFVSNSDVLAAERCGLQLDENGYLITDELLRTNLPGIYAVGDVNGKFQFRHKANYEAYIVARNLYESDKAPRVANYDHVPWAIFTHPQIAHVGLTEEESRFKGYDLLVATHHYSSTAKGYAMGYLPGDPDDGFVKMIVDKNTKKLLGVHVIGPHASALVQPYIHLMEQGLPYTVIDETMTIHPALSEVVAWATYYLQ
ncbi:MAG: NAD(P)/FAD-dependent oxidoreductase [Eubacteriales bacterium]|nr:NAD(P)/FAD-dependent oxidoreductase [Eubacteriales bacterium]